MSCITATVTFPDNLSANVDIPRMLGEVSVLDAGERLSASVEIASGIDTSVTLLNPKMDIDVTRVCGLGYSIWELFAVREGVLVLRGGKKLNVLKKVVDNV